MSEGEKDGEVHADRGRAEAVPARDPAASAADAAPVEAPPAALPSAPASAAPSDDRKDIPRAVAAPGPAEAPPAAAVDAPGPAAIGGAATIGEPVPDGFVAAYEHSAVVRFCHWLNAVALTVMITSGWRIFKAFPSFGPRLPEHKLLNIPEAITLGGWLGGALQWHYTFMWVFTATGLIYVGYLVASGEYRMMLFRPRDIPGVWPMARHYFFFGPAPRQTEAYNALQKLAYTSVVLFGAVSVLTGIVILRPVQFSGLAWLMGGFHLARVWHFAAMCGFVAFIPGHLVMVALHGWNNFMSMVRGWKKNPEYL
jgi:thiosulfate reductase cytochrome b subunit